MVGVHVRRGDMASSPTAGYRTPPPSYYLRAMLYFHARLPHVHFFVVTDDPTWAAATFRDLVPRVVTVMTSLTQKNPLLAQHGDVVDLAFLAQFCDHVVGSVGTFGWWGAWLNERQDADVVFYDSPVAMDTTLAAGFSYEDFFLPHWKLMGD